MRVAHCGTNATVAAGLRARSARPAHSVPRVLLSGGNLRAVGSHAPLFGAYDLHDTVDPKRHDGDRYDRGDTYKYSFWGPESLQLERDCLRAQARLGGDGVGKRMDALGTVLRRCAFPYRERARVALSGCGSVPLTSQRCLSRRTPTRSHALRSVPKPLSNAFADFRFDRNGFAFHKRGSGKP